MEFTFPQKIRVGLGSSQQAGLQTREAGNRALVLSEPVNAGSREKAVLEQILERAGVRSLSLDLLEGQNPRPFLKEAMGLAKSGFAEMIVTMGSGRMISLGRKLSMDLDLPLFELPSTPVVPFLLRNEGWIGNGQPNEWEVFSTKLKTPPHIFLDPYLSTGATALSSVAAFVEMAFLALEAASWDGCDPFSRTLAEAALKMWPLARQVFESPQKAEFRMDSFYSGLALSQLLAQIPRGPGLTALTLLGAVTKLPAFSGGAVLLPHLLENHLWKRPGLLKMAATAMDIPGDFPNEPSGGESLAREIRKQLAGFGLPLRFQELSLIESEITLVGDMVKGSGLRKGFFLDEEEVGQFLRGAF